MYNPQPFDKRKDIKPAIKWHKEHREHIQKMLENYSGPAYAPCGSDCINPSLWKPGHWLWFYRNILQLDNNQSL